MSHNRAFLEAIRAEPDSMDLRLIYADWLEEQDEPRGSFIRAQCLAETLDPRDPMRIAMQIESDAYLDAYRSDWNRTLPTSWCAMGFRRGFVERIRVCMAHEAEAAQAYRTAEPLREIELMFPQDSDACETTIDPTLLDGLSGVELHSGYTRNDLQRILESTSSTLTSFGLMGTRVGTSELELLSRSALSGRLKELSLSLESINSIDAAQHFFACTSLEELQSLSLHNALAEEGDRPLFDTLARLPALRTLSLRDCDFTSWDLGSFHRQRDWSTLEELRFHKPLDGGSLFAHLAQASLPNLHALEVTDSLLRQDEDKSFPRSMFLKGLAVLSLVDCALYDTETIRLVRSSKLDGLHSLDLSLNPAITSDSIQALAESPSMAGLVRLRLRGANVGDDGVIALATSPYVRNLRELDLCKCNIGSRGIEALAQSRNFTQLRRLNLSKNALDSRDAKTLATTSYLYNLMSLALHRNAIDDRGAIALAEADTFPNLTCLGMHDNWIREGGASKMMELFAEKRLHRLQLRGNSLGQAGEQRLTAWSRARGKFPRFDGS